MGGNSTISAINGNVDSIGLDGNIEIDTEFLVAIPGENSDIVATGFGRSGGSNIRITATAPQGIFGIQYQEQLTPDNDIVATETVELNTLVLEPSFTVINLPA